MRDGITVEISAADRVRRALITLVLAIGLIVVTWISLNLYHWSYLPSETTGILPLRASPLEAVVSLDGTSLRDPEKGPRATSNLSILYIMDWNSCKSTSSQ